MNPPSLLVMWVRRGGARYNAGGRRPSPDGVVWGWRGRNTAPPEASLASAQDRCIASERRACARAVASPLDSTRSTAATACQALHAPRRMRSGGRLVAEDVGLERQHAGHEPAGPHLVDLGLEVVDVVVGKVSKQPLLQQVVAYRQPLLPPLRDLLRLAVQREPVVQDLEQREDPGQHRELAQLVGHGSNEWMNVGPPILSARRIRFMKSTA